MNFISERKQLLAAAQEISTSKMVVGTWGNASVRIAGQDLFLITPSGMDYETMLPEDLVLVNYQGETVAGQWKPSVEMPMHLAIYQQRAELGAIVHVHSPYASVFAVAGMPIPVVLEETAQVIGHEIRVADYAICGSDQLAVNSVQTLGSGKAVLLANHGMVGVGKDLSDALKVCYITEKTAMVALYAYSLGGPHSLPAEDVASLQKAFSAYGQHKPNTSTVTE